MTGREEEVSTAVGRPEEEGRRGDSESEGEEGVAVVLDFDMPCASVALAAERRKGAVAAEAGDDGGGGGGGVQRMCKREATTKEGAAGCRGCGSGSVVVAAASPEQEPTVRSRTRTRERPARERDRAPPAAASSIVSVFNISGMNMDADQRITHDVEKLTTDLASLVTGMVKPPVDILWFTWRMKVLSGRRGVAILYAYMLVGLGFLRAVSPDFGDLANQEQELEGTFRFMHSRLRTHAESIAFFVGGSREKAMIEAKFTTLLDHSRTLLRKRWLYGIFDDFVTKQLPHNVTWGLSLLYALEQKGDRALTSTQGDLAHALRFLASVMSQSFIAFGDILELHKKFVELSGGINRIFELEELLQASQSSPVSGPTPSR